MKTDKQKVASITIGVVALIIIVIGLSWFGSKPGKYDDFAICLSESGAKFYGAFWCPHCKEQKAYFGSSQKFLPYIECSTPDRQSQLQVCQDQEIQSYPTWKFDGDVTRPGTMSLEDLAEQTGCELPA